MSIMMCEHCGDQVDTDYTIGEWDEGVDKWFCDIECQLKWYQNQHNALCAKNNQLSFEAVTQEARADDLYKDTRRALACAERFWRRFVALGTPEYKTMKPGCGELFGMMCGILRNHAYLNGRKK